MANPISINPSALGAANRQLALDYMIAELRKRGWWTQGTDPTGPEAKAMFENMLWDEFKDGAHALSEKLAREAATQNIARIDE